MKKLIIAALAVAVTFGATSTFAQDTKPAPKAKMAHHAKKAAHRHHKKAAAAAADKK